MSNFFQTDFDALGFEVEPIPESISRTNGESRKGTYVVSDAVRSKQRLKAIQRWQDLDFRNKVISSLKNKKLSDSHRISISLATKRRWENLPREFTPEHREKIRQSLRKAHAEGRISYTYTQRNEVRARIAEGVKRSWVTRPRTLSIETRKKISKAYKPRIMSAEERQRRSEVMKGRRHTPETIAKIKATKRRKRLEYLEKKYGHQDI